jgi:hypothetical protein
MLISGRTQAQERRYQAIKITRIAARYDQAIAREINRAMNDAATKLGNPLAADQVRNKHAEKMADILTKLWTDAGNTSVSGAFKIAKSFLQMEFKRDITTPIVDNAIAGWIKAFGGTQITEITSTTMSDINKIVSDARIDGLSERDTARLIHEVAPFKSASRAQTIARTEAHGASQGISLDVANQTDIPMVKVWLSDRSGSARASHLRIDGQKRALSQPFDVDGEKLDYPGDSSGSAGNVINCKCVIGYDVA